METHIKQVFDLIERFLDGHYDPWAFSYDLPGELVVSGNEIRKESELVMDAFNEDLPEICADYDDDYPLDKFKQRVRVEYEKAKAIYEQEKH